MVAAAIENQQAPVAFEAESTLLPAADTLRITLQADIVLVLIVTQTALGVTTTVQKGARQAAQTEGRRLARQARVQARQAEAIRAVELVGAHHKAGVVRGVQGIGGHAAQAHTCRQAGKARRRTGEASIKSGVPVFICGAGVQALATLQVTTQAGSTQTLPANASATRILAIQAPERNDICEGAIWTDCDTFAFG